MWPSWSPDGRISFVSGGGISVMNADGSGVVLLLSHEFAYPGCQPPVSIYAWWGDCVADPSWSPDGRRIAFYAGDAGYGLAEVYTMNADGSAPMRLVSPGETSGWNGVLPAWSPDGARVAFEWGGPLSHISSLPREGTGTLTSHATGYAPAWSPDGHWLAYRGTGRYEQRIVGTNIVTGEFHGPLIPEAEGPADPNYWDTQVDWSHTIP
jgi:Tol biopolymer transport system component